MTAHPCAHPNNIGSGPRKASISEGSLSDGSLSKKPRGRRIAALLTRVMSQRTAIGATLRELPGRMEKVSRQCALILEMLDDVAAGHLEQVPWRSVVVGAIALLYATSPADLVPDTVPLLGSLDDMVVLAIAVRLVRADLERYCALKGYAHERYF